MFAAATLILMSQPLSFRPPAVPLVTHDPYFSVWSFTDAPTDDHTKHWTGAATALVVMARVDGKVYRLVGREPNNVEAAKMASLEVAATRTTYRMEAGPVQVSMEFLSPLLPDDVEALALPASYLTLEAKAADGKSHQVEFYADVSAEWCVNTVDQAVGWSRYLVDGNPVLALASKDQPILAKKGDNLRIDWGTMLLTSPQASQTALRSARTARGTFADAGKMPDSDDLRMPRAASDDWPVAALVLGPVKVGSEAVSQHVTLAYDDVWAVEYLGRKLPSLWRERGGDAADLIRLAEKRYPEIRERCKDFDAKLAARLEKAGGAKFATLAQLAYRQSIAGHKVVRDVDGDLLMFSKENFSNGCMATVDVMYPATPLYLALAPELLEAQLRPILEYAAGSRWPWPFAPHDIGTYPLANGQVYGGGERTEEDQMPVEESGNMLIAVAAYCQRTGKADLAKEFWPVLTEWAEYLNEKGLDPEHQLCTDDFAGHLAHNANLSVKAIVALACYGKLCEATGHSAEAKKYAETAKQMATKWVKMADDGDHYRLAFDKPGTWSQKYNMVWDQLLKLDLFPPEVMAKELAFYLKHQGKYGLPLDNRARYTKADWILWTATMAPDRQTFDKLVDPVFAYANETPSRVPFSDWYDVDNAKQIGFQARTVIGGVFMPLLREGNLGK